MPRARRPYPSDLTDQEWELLEPLLESSERRGPPPKWPARRVADAVFYLLRSGCAWRMLPKEYPPWQSVYYHFRRRWRLDGRLRRAHDRLREAVRESQGRDRNPSASVIDSQAVKTSRAGGPERGYDGAKRLAGRKRHILVDTNGLVLAVRVHGADLPDRDGGRRLAGRGLGREAPSSGAGVGRRGLHGRFPRVGPGEAGLACGGALPPRPAAVALRAGGKAARLPGSAPALGGREDFRVAESGSPSEQGLRAAARDGRGDDLRGDEPAHAAQASAGSVKDFTPALQIRCLQNSF